MCGIFGKLYFQNTIINNNDFLPSLNALSRRGPNDKGFYSDPNIIIGSTRLSIVDLSQNGHMPMSNEDKSLWIVYNGEIYNYLEIRKQLLKKHQFKSKSDTEVILHLFEEKGVRCLDYLRGMFAFAIWNSRDKSLFLARDRLGKKPLKYYHDNEFFIFASELKAILKDSAVSKKIDYEAINDYLTFQYIPAPRTGFKNIFKLPAAHYLIIKPSKKLSIIRYWDLNFNKKMDISFEKSSALVLDKMRESVAIRLKSEVPLGIYLSGGIDSSMIVALASEISSKKLNTFTVGFQEKDFDERKYAKIIAEKYKTNHREIIVKSDITEILPEIVYSYEEPFADSSIIPTWFMFKSSRDLIKVGLNGDGGDENFFGYDRYLHLLYYQIFRKLIFYNEQIPASLKKILPYSANKKILRKISKFFQMYHGDENLFYLHLVSCFKRSDKKNYYGLELLKSLSTMPSLEKFQKFDILTYLPDDLLVKNDIASMAHSIEIRSPFLDHELMELCAQVPVKFKMNYFRRKHMFKKIASQYLPKQIINREKKGFNSPLDFWLRKDLKKYLKKRLLHPKFINQGLFSKEYLNNIVDSNHEQNYQPKKLWTLLMLAEWLKVWFD